jgi:hypothetical protein
VIGKTAMFSRRQRWAVRRAAVLVIAMAVSATALSPRVDAATSGGWTIVPSPDRATTGTLLDDVACVATAHCWAVGEAGRNVFLARSGGRSWSRVHAPQPGAGRAYRLLGVTCTSKGDCWAVGQDYAWRCGGCPDDLTLIEHWDGRSWTIAPTQVFGELSDVTCMSATDCWAVGYMHNLSPPSDATLIEHWDGSSWQVTTSPTTMDQQRFLTGVTCVSSAECWAVGWIAEGSASQPIIDRWDGSSWTAVPSPSVPSIPRLFGVSCPATMNCWAVGDSSFASGAPPQLLVEHWDGTAWSVVSAESPGSDANGLADVSCASATSCQAVGNRTDAGVSQTLAEVWDGSDWTVVSSENTDTTVDNHLMGVTCQLTRACWSAGFSGNFFSASSRRTLIETLPQ